MSAAEKTVHYARLRYGATVYLTRISSPFREAEVWDPIADAWVWADDTLTEDSIELYPGRTNLGTSEDATEEVKQEIRKLCADDGLHLVNSTLVPVADPE